MEEQAGRIFVKEWLPVVHSSERMGGCSLDLRHSRPSNSKDAGVGRVEKWVGARNHHYS